MQSSLVSVAANASISIRGWAGLQANSSVFSAELIFQAWISLKVPKSAVLSTAPSWHFLNMILPFRTQRSVLLIRLRHVCASDVPGRWASQSVTKPHYFFCKIIWNECLILTIRIKIYQPAERRGPQSHPLGRNKFTAILLNLQIDVAGLRRKAVNMTVDRPKSG